MVLVRLTCPPIENPDTPKGPSPCLVAQFKITEDSIIEEHPIKNKSETFRKEDLLLNT